MPLILLCICNGQSVDRRCAARTLSSCRVHDSERMWSNVTHFEGVYERLATEVEDLSSFVAKRKDEAKARHAVDAFDLSRIAVRRGPRIKAGDDLGRGIVGLLQRQDMHLAWFAYKDKVGVAFGVN